MKEQPEIRQVEAFCGQYASDEKCNIIKAQSYLFIMTEVFHLSCYYYVDKIHYSLKVVAGSYQIISISQTAFVK